MTEPESSRDRDDHWWRGHLGWLLGGVPILLALIRVAAVARFDPATASAIVSKADTLAILSNVFFLFAPVLLLVALDIAAHSLRTDGLPWFIIVLITGTPAVAVMVTAPISYVLVALLSVSYVYVARFGIVSRYSPPSWRRVPIQSRASVVAMVVSLAMVLLLFDVWIPSERLTHSGGQAVGYVLGEEGGWLTVLRASDRSVSIVRSADVTDRKIWVSCTEYRSLG